jgi:hypothetical protein
MNPERIEQLLKTEWPVERTSRQHLPTEIGARRPLKPEIRVRARSPFSFRAAAAGLVVVVVGCTLLAGAWLHYRPAVASPSPSPSQSASPSPTQSAAPSPSPTVSPSPDLWPTYSFRPSPPPSSIAIAGKASVGTKQRTGADEATNLQWDFWEPRVETPGRSAGSRINSAVEAVLDSRVAELKREFGDPQRGGPPDQTVTLISTFVVISSAGPKSDSSAGFLTVRIDYTFNNAPWADAGPQYIDFLSYDLATGKRISISDLFTNTGTALQRLSAAAAADPVVLEGSPPDDSAGGPYATGAEPTPDNFAMWAPTRTGLEITFAAGQVSAWAAGTPAITLPWSGLRDLVKPNSYLAWYLAQAPSAGPSHGAFGLTGSMLTSEQSPNAVLLKDGRVLVAGLRAELYDPASGAFSDTGPLPSARYGRSATVLLNGQVLVAGGTNFDQSEIDASAQLYDPRTGKFTATGSMALARAYHTATLLEDGRVLIVGGTNTVYTVNPDGSTPTSSNLASAELYDPRTGTFTATGSMTTGRAFQTATLLADGRVLIAGGRSESYSYSPDVVLASAELYDPQTGRFTATGSMTAARSSHAATRLNDGRVLIAGGDSSGAAAELYDPATGIFRATGSTETTSHGPSATLLPDGRVLIVGGGASAELYDPQTGTFGATGSMVLARYGTSAVLLQDGRVLVVGGEITGGASAELYRP